MVAIERTGMGGWIVSLGDLARPPSAAFDALVRDAPAAVVYGRGAPEHVTALPDGRDLTLPEGTRLRLIGRSGANAFTTRGTVAALDDGTVVWGPFLMTSEDPSWREQRAHADACAAIESTRAGYPAIPGTAQLMATPPESQGTIFRMSPSTADLVAVPSTEHAAYRYVFNDATGPMVLNAREALLGPHLIGSEARDLLVRATGQVVEVGLLRALELEIVYARFPCFFDAALAR
jgi:hypothetical protein